MKTRRLLLLSMIGLCGMGQGPQLKAAGDRIDPVLLEQLRVVEDPEGTANVRTGPSVQSDIAGHLPTGAVVAIESGPAKDWVKLWTEAEEDAPRYIHSSRLRPVLKWRQLIGQEVEGQDACTVQADGLKATVKAMPFVAKNHRITKNKHGLELVDGESPWGMDGGLPKQSLTLSVSLNGQAVALPKEALSNLYQPNLDTLVLLTPAKDSGQALLVMTNGDGAGGYCVAWSFRKGVYTGRAVFVPF